MIFQLAISESHANSWSWGWDNFSVSMTWFRSGSGLLTTTITKMWWGWIMCRPKQLFHRCFHFLFLKNVFIDFYREWKQGETETSVSCLPHGLWQGLNLQPRYVLWPGIETPNFWCTAWCPNQVSHTGQDCASIPLTWLAQSFARMEDGEITFLLPMLGLKNTVDPFYLVSTSFTLLFWQTHISLQTLH